MLSAVAFWESTRFGDESGDLAFRARYAQVEEDQRWSNVQALVAHDLSVSERCRTAALLRDDALIQYSQSFADPDLSAVMEAELTRGTLESLRTVRTEQRCAPLDRPSIEQVAAAQMDVRDELAGSEDPATLRARIARFSRAEGQAVAATLIFALAVLALTAAEHAATVRRTDRWIALAVLFLFAGFAFIVSSSVSSKQVPRAATLLTLAFAVLMALLAIAIRAEHPQILRLRRRACLGGRILGRAEVLGAMTVVVLTLSAWGFTASSANERKASVEADALMSEARRALELGQESTLSVLDRMQELVALRASGAARAEAETWSSRTTEMWKDEQEAWEALAAEQGEEGVAEVDEPGCFAGDAAAVVLPWRSHVVPADAKEGGRPASFPSAVLAEFRDDPRTIDRLVNVATTGSTVCSMQAAIMSQRALDWGDRALRFTVAIVVLGLAGLFFALASSTNMSQAPQHWLLAAALIGLLAGSLLVVTAGRSIPPDVDEEEVERGSLAFAQSRAALKVGECEEARGASEVAVQALSGSASAHRNQANVALCNETASWLSKPYLPAERRHVAVEELEHVVTGLGERSSSSMGWLGWAYTLEGLGRRHDERSGELLERGAAWTEKALRAEPTRPHLCFNWALAALISGDPAEAKERYAAAMSALRSGPGPHGECRPSGLPEAQQPWFVTAALADLELLGDDAVLDDIRELLVTGSLQAGVNVGSSGGWSLAIFPQAVHLARADGAGVRDVSAVWYHRVSDDEPWAVMTWPTYRTLTPGNHALLWPVETLLEDGGYRVDVYVAGEPVERVEVASDWWGSRGLSSADFRRVVLNDLGMSAVVPEAWAISSTEWGDSVKYVGQGGFVEFRRQEGVSRRDMPDSVATWSDLPVDELHEGEWYLGMGDTLGASAQGRMVGVGHEQYLTSEVSSFDVSDDSCPGRALMTRVVADEESVAESVWLSQVRVETPYFATVEDVGLTGAYKGPTLSVEIPAGWLGFGCPGQVGATQTRGEADFFIRKEDSSISAAESVAEALLSFENDPFFEDFHSSEPREVLLSNGVAASEITYTWTTEIGPVKQMLLVATVSGRLYYLTFTTPERVFDEFEEERERVLRTFAPS